MIKGNEALSRSALRMTIAVALMCIASGPVGRALASGSEPDHVIVELVPGSDSAAIAAALGSEVAHQVPGTTLYRLTVPLDTKADAFLEALSVQPAVAFAERDSAVEYPEVRGDPIHLPFEVTVDPAAYAYQPAYDKVRYIQTSADMGAPVVVAVLDTGVNAAHPDLVGRCLPGYSAIAGDSAPDDAPDGATNNAVGHGTMIAGLIARLAPTARILPVRVLNGDGVGTMLGLVEGIYYAIDRGARVINISLGSVRPCRALDEALARAKSAGAVVVAAAGNNGADELYYPAAIEHVIAVGSVELDSMRSWYSNYGKFVSVVAPGTAIRSTFWNGGYATWSGTSFAAPLVTAEAAILLSAAPNAKVERVRKWILKTARSVDRENPYLREKLGRGTIDMRRALRAAAHDDCDDDSDSD